MFQFPVSPEKEKDLINRLKRLGLHRRDFEEQFTPSSGPGGQRANKASTGVRVTYRLSGQTVKTDKTRSQGLNRFFAWRALLDKIEETLLKTPSRATQKRNKIRHQKKRRERRSRKKIFKEPLA